MELRNVIAVIGLLIVAAGVVWAIGGATVNGTASQTRWGGTTAGSVTTQGGNITNVNISATSLTTKWADFYGNLTGTIILGNASSGNVYSWTYGTSTPARVCLTTNSSWITSAVPSTATGGNIDTVWAFATTDADSGTNTYSSSNCNLNLSGGTVSNTGNVTLQGNSTFSDCVIGNGASAAAGLMGNYAFCTNTNSAGKSYNNQSANFEVMVAVNKTSTGTYYFYAELG